MTYADVGKPAPRRQNTPPGMVTQVEYRLRCSPQPPCLRIGTPTLRVDPELTGRPSLEEASSWSEPMAAVNASRVPRR